jgi:transposase-like protein
MKDLQIYRALPAVDHLKADEHLPEASELRQVKYLNNQVEQEHRFIKRLTKPGIGFGSFNAQGLTLRAMEAMNMIRTRASPRR